MKILDACCGGKMFWYEKHLEFVDFQDNRELQTELCDGRIFSVEPDFIGDVNNKQKEELERAVNNVIQSWIDKHGLNINAFLVEDVEQVKV